MTDRPIPFSAPMVRALLDGTKTQTRRALFPPYGTLEYLDDGTWRPICTKFFKGDRLWVRESYYQRGHWEPVEGAQTKGGRQKWAFVPADYFYTFDEPAEYRKGRHHKDPGTVAWHKRLGRFMPRAVSRLTLTVTDVRVERLQDISEADAIAEGALVPWTGFDRDSDTRTGRSEFEALWNHINGPGAWEANPWVVALSFTVGHHNIDVSTPAHERITR